MPIYGPDPNAIKQLDRRLVLSAIVELRLARDVPTARRALKEAENILRRSGLDFSLVEPTQMMPEGQLVQYCHASADMLQNMTLGSPLLLLLKFACALAIVVGALYALWRTFGKG